MHGANVEFPDDREIWIDFRYEGLHNYCLICGNMRHVTRCCKSEILGEEASEVDTKVLYAFKGLDKEYDLRGNCLGGRTSLLGQRVDDVHRGPRVKMVLPCLRIGDNNLTQSI